MPAILVATFALFEFGLIVLTYQTIAVAAVEGAREAARLDTVSTADKLTAVQNVVEKYLHVQNDDIQITVDGNIILEDGPNGTTAQLTLNPANPPATPASVTATEVRVTVSLRLTNAFNKPVRDWLETFGFTTGNRRFEVSTLLPVE